MSNVLIKQELDTGWPWPFGSVQGWFESFWNAVQSWIWSAADWLRNTLSSTINNVTNYVYYVGNWLWNKISPAIASITQQIWNGLNWLKEKVEDCVAELVDSILHALRDFLHWIASTISSFISENIVKPIWDALQWIFGWIYNALKGIWDWIINMLQNVANALKHGDLMPAVMLVGTIGIVGISISAMLSAAGVKILGSGIDTSGLQAFLHELIDARTMTSAFVGSLVAVAVAEPARQWARATFRTTLPPVDTIIDFCSKNIISIDEMRNLLARHGYSDVFAEYLWIAHYRPLHLDQIREALWRGIISLSEYKTYLDIIDIYDKQRPGMNISDKDIVLGITYRLPNWRETRRMLKWNVITRNDLMNFIKADGIDPKWIPKVVEGEFRDLLAEERQKLAAIYLEKYTLGLINEDELRARLKSLYLSDEEVEWRITLAKEEYALLEFKENLKALEEAYKKDIVTSEEVYNQLLQWGLREDRALRLLEIWSYRKLPRPRY